MQKLLKEYSFITIGCFLYGIYISVFLVPNGIGAGGLAGISMCMNYLFGTKIGVTMAILNIPLFILGFRLIGKKFTIMSAIIVFISSIFIDFLNAAFTFPVLEEKLLATIFAGVLSGIAMSLLFIGGASTGGMDISAKLIKNKFKNIDLTKILLIQDIVIYIFVAIVLGVNAAMYAIIMCFIRSKTIDAIQEGLASSRQCIIISDLSDEIVHEIQIKLARGVTLLNAEGAYTNTNKKFIYVVLQKNQLVALKKIVDNLDPNAFITVTAVSNVLGNFKQTAYSVQ